MSPGKDQKERYRRLHPPKPPSGILNALLIAACSPPPRISSPTGVVELATAVAAADGDQDGIEGDAPLHFYDPARELCPSCGAAQCAFGTRKTYCQSPSCLDETGGKGRKVYIWTGSANKAKKEQLEVHGVSSLASLSESHYENDNAENAEDDGSSQPGGMMGFKDKDGNGVGWKDALQFFDISPARELCPTHCRCG